MLQQTQVATVIPVLRALPRRVSRRGERLPRRRSSACSSSGAGSATTGARISLHRAARAVVAEHGGVFPRDAATLAALPGIGRSTAAAIAAFAFGARGAILDGNVKRVLARHAASTAFRATRGSSARSVAAGRGAAAGARNRNLHAGADGSRRDGVPARRAALRRLSRSPRDCVARREHRIAELPAPRPKKALPQRAITVLLLERTGEVLLERRPATRHLGRTVEPAGARDRRRRVRALPRRASAPTVAPRPRAAADRARLHALPPDAAAAAVRGARRWPRAREEPGLLWLPLADAPARRCRRRSRSCCARARA